MSEAAPAASKGSDISLVDLERELDALLLEYESLSRAWPKEPHILTRAKIGRRVEDTLRRICELQQAIAKAQATTLGCVLISGSSRCRSRPESTLIANYATMFDKMEISPGESRLRLAGTLTGCGASRR